MAKRHWKPKKRFGQATGRHTKLNKYRRTVNFTCISMPGLKMKFKKKVWWHKRSNMIRKLSSGCNEKEQFQCMRTGDLMKLRLKKVSDINVKGYRMINIQSLENEMNVLLKHCVSCVRCLENVKNGQKAVRIINEKRTQGLASVLEIKFTGCGTKHCFESSPKLKVNNYMKYDINVRAVWGSIATGNGASHLKEMMATMDSPSLSQPAFTTIEQDIGNWWANLSEQEILEAGAEERRLAIEKGHYHQGVPYITVIADGGWSKRTHKHSYNALGGVGIIIGKETGKILHIGMRNKYCYICSRYENEKSSIPEHVCYKNWNSNSQAMEADIILEGFLNAENKHGLRYMNLVADGDSSVYARIREEVPIWGKDVQKIECANHACKCLRSSLEKLVDSNPSYKGRNKLTKAVRVRLVSAVRCAIRMRSRESDKKRGALQLVKDIRNSIHHIFGNHSNCSDFCKASTQDPCSVNDGDIETEEKSDNDLMTVCTDNSLFWTEGSSITQQEQSRLGCDLEYNNLDSNMLQDISIIFGRIANKSERLISNTTTNLAECWMHIRSKFDGGKVLNLCNRASWNTRCFGGLLRQNIGPQWSPILWRKCTETLAGHHFVSLYEDRTRQLQHSNASKSKPNQSQLRWKRKMKAIKESTSESSRLAYGQEALEFVPDHDKHVLEDIKNQYLEKHIDISPEKINAIERLTKNQSISNVWFEERRKRITASNFGKVLKRKPAIPVAKLVQSLLYSGFKGTTCTRIGIHQERNTIQEYILKRADEGVNVTVKQTGLTIHPTMKYLGGSPDGIVFENGIKCGLIEVKNVLFNKNINLNQAANSQKTFCLKLENKKLSLKTNHDYFYQCQGLLQICDMPWIDFVVRTMNPYQLHIERIYRDDNSWSHNSDKLKAFYFSSLLPELAAPRKGCSPGIREPGVWFKDKKQNPVKRKRPIQKVQPRTTGVTSPKPCTSTASDTPSQNICTTKLKPASRRSSRRTKFVGRRISHEWKECESSTRTTWYSGTVTSVISGVDGCPNVVYEVLYDEEEEPFEIDHLLPDFESGSVKFIDI